MEKMTTLFVNNQKLEYDYNEGCHGGGGPFKLRDLIGSVKEKGLLRFIHDDIVLPGSSFGDHRHDAEGYEEWYLCLSGHGVMTCDGAEYPMGPGDISPCFKGGSHGVTNTGVEDMRILVIGIQG
ncbi:MAG: cupin domain-containing protein [Planctomycetes bacterium]|nr:cupin domain-containing protein [Planctomycetota bacterium]